MPIGKGGVLKAISGAGNCGTDLSRAHEQEHTAEHSTVQLREAVGSGANKQVKGKGIKTRNAEVLEGKEGKNSELGP